MVFKCVKCLETSSHKEDILECSMCKNILHFYCTGYTEQSFKKMTNNTKSRYLCTDCKAHTPKSPKFHTNEITAITGNSMEKKSRNLLSQYPL